MKRTLCAIGLLAAASSAEAATPCREVGHFLEAVSAATPELLWMERLSFDGEQVQIQGKAFNTNAIASFIENLDRLPGFAEPTLRNVSQEGGKRYRFDLSFERELPPVEQAPLEIADDELPQVLERLHALIERQGVAVKTWPPETLSDPSGPPVVVTISIDANSFNDLVLLFDRLQRFPQPVAVATMDIKKSGAVDQSGLSVDLHLEIQGKPAGGQGFQPRIAPSDWAALSL